MAGTTESGNRARALGAALLLPLLLASWDLARGLGAPPRISLGAGVLVFVSVAWALGALLATIALLARTELRSRLERWGPGGAAVGGALDAFALFVLCVVAQNPRALDADERVWLLAGSVTGFALLRATWAGAAFTAKAAVERALALACAAGASALLAGLRWNGHEWFRLALQLVLAVAFARALPAAFARAARRLAPACLACALLLAVASGPLLAASNAARFALHHESSHARTWAFVYQRLADGDRDGATVLFGGRDCDGARAGVFPGATERPGDGLDANCSGGEHGGGSARDVLLTAATPAAAPARSPRGIARGSDVIILSIDSWRWDAGELRALREALGPHAVFERAISPAPGTKESLSATLRGRAVRQLRFEPAELARGKVLWRDPSPTLAHSLVKAGYRAVTVPTSNIADPRVGVPAGFEAIWIANFDARTRPPARSPFTQSYVPAAEVFPVALQVARDTPGPLCLWLHLMEPHSPYHVDGPPADTAEPPRARFERALRETDARLAELVRELARIRRRQALVAVFGDHGEEFGEHGGEHHASSVYAEQVRVGWLLAGPGVPSGRYALPVSTAQLPATLLDLLGLPVPRSMTQPSLVSALAQAHAEGRDQLAVSELRGEAMTMTAYTGARFRYLYDPVHELELLFDTQRDPLDQHDLSAAEPQALARMRVLARDWDERH